MQTSRAQLERLLDPDNESVTLATLTRAARGWASTPNGPVLRSSRQRGNSGQGAALEPFEEGAAGGRHVRELVGDARGIERGDRITPTRDRRELAGFGQRRRLARERERALAEWRHLEGAERAVPQQDRKSTRLNSSH